MLNIGGRVVSAEPAPADAGRLPMTTDILGSEDFPPSIATATGILSRISAAIPINIYWS
jgi:hypothetical protein